MPSAPSATSVAPTAAVSQIPPKVESFPTLLNLAMITRDTREHALHLGIDETALIRYADGAVCDEEHRFLTGILAKNRWALDFVVNHIKQRNQRGQPRRRVA